MNAEKIGALMLRIWEDEKALEKAVNCGNEIAAQLRVMADCLDDSHDAQVLSFPGEGMFSSDHTSQAYVRGFPSGDIGHPFQFPQHAEKVMRDVFMLRQRIKANRRNLDEERKRAQS